ncbi:MULTISPECIES: STAS domain-containing protein [Amycolatopsis]|uniref:Anti-sigma factor antagonist n=2 Tax=Amycolatopsis TaxID=1813 RepID=A0A1I3QV48_9PSEU|nr:STAS domain-containing protein [Amycolatopsis sacchari]SFJ38034.1 anti-sigma B factor antagonist [Amycolatopsis sacchari]
MSLTVEWTRGRGRLVVSVSGEVDAGSSPRLQEGIAAAHAADEPPSPTLVLDLDRVEFLDSAGLAVLVETASDCHKAGQELRLVATGRAVLNPLKLTGLDQIFTVLDAVPAAPAN